MPKHLCIHLGPSGDLELRFRIRQTPLAELWTERMLARTAWPMDHHDRFYGLGTTDHRRDVAVAWIKHCIALINSHEHIIDRPFELTQDCLNYLHHIFECQHGLLNEQRSEFWQSAPDIVRRALSELNLAVHQCEAALHGVNPRFVCTWFGMPKTHQLPEWIRMCYGDWRVTWGTVYLNYCEIGKTAEDLARDNDRYIDDQSFKPFEHYSADFFVALHDRNLNGHYGQIQHYIDQHPEFFVARGVTSVYNAQVRPLRYPVADIIFDGNRERMMWEITQQQWVKKVILE